MTSALHHRAAHIRTARVGAACVPHEYLRPVSIPATVLLGAGILGGGWLAFVTKMYAAGALTMIAGVFGSKVLDDALDPCEDGAKL